MHLEKTNIAFEICFQNRNLTEHKKIMLYTYTRRITNTFSIHNLLRPVYLTVNNFVLQSADFTVLQKRKKNV